MVRTKEVFKRLESSGSGKANPTVARRGLDGPCNGFERFLQGDEDADFNAESRGNLDDWR